MAVLSEISGQFKDRYRRGLRDIAEYGHDSGGGDDRERALLLTAKERATPGPDSPSVKLVQEDTQTGVPRQPIGMGGRADATLE